MSSAVMRGLSLFIGDVRNCQSREQEQKVVDKEMAKIRKKFTNKGLSGYDKKKYVWKLIYMHILGYEVDFGHMEALNLINSPKYTEKCTGYIATGIMMNEKSMNIDLLEMVLNSIRSDLMSGNEVFESLALSTIANIGAVEFANKLHAPVQKLAFAEDYKPTNYIRKKACLCLYSFLKRNKNIMEREVWARSFRDVLESKNYGVLLSGTGLILGTMLIHGIQGFDDTVPKLIMIMQRIHDYSTDYLYYLTPCPWLQIRVLKILQLFPPPTDKNLLNMINEVLLNIVTSTEVTKNVNKNNADHAILFEAINLVIRYKGSAFEGLRKDIIAILGRFISVREPNIRYIALDTMSLLSHNTTIASYLIKEHL